jgi:hypothetical protein
MDREYEKILVKNFIEKRLQERVTFELASEKKRLDALSRLCHSYMSSFVQKYMIEIPKPNSDFTLILNILKTYGANDICYAISFNKEIDGQQLPLKSALEKAVGSGMPSIISCLPDKLVYFESEQECGSPARYVLLKKLEL